MIDLTVLLVLLKNAFGQAPSCVSGAQYHKIESKPIGEDWDQRNQHTVFQVEKDRWFINEQTLEPSDVECPVDNIKPFLLCCLWQWVAIFFKRTIVIGFISVSAFQIEFAFSASS